jgi:hypothetical protein
MYARRNRPSTRSALPETMDAAASAGNLERIVMRP